MINIHCILSNFITIRGKNVKYFPGSVTYIYFNIPHITFLLCLINAFIEVHVLVYKLFLKRLRRSNYTIILI